MKNALNSKEEIPVGCVIVYNGKVIAESTNEVESMRNPLMHAEIIAINNALKVLDTKFLCNCIMFCTLEPCLMCMEAIKLSRIKRLIFGAYQKKENLNSVDKIGGICEFECKNLLQKFFKSIRANR